MKSLRFLTVLISVFHVSCTAFAGTEVTGRSVKEISYEEFGAYRGGKENFTLVDVLSRESYEKGHIEGAISFPLDTINKKTAARALSNKARTVIVYCGGFKCHASTKAALKLEKLGYNVLDYKGGLEEWQNKGNKLLEEERR
ncbi:MAG: rhodanese-like domain-containing protein [Candidatus Omnitrophica bacterium]|nr:rhodanese-like domain-containing protein [Candidatus Omnitrophota bacterium]